MNGGPRASHASPQNKIDQFGLAVRPTIAKTAVRPTIAKTSVRPTIAKTAVRPTIAKTSIDQLLLLQGEG